LPQNGRNLVSLIGETALIVPVPEAEPTVAELRARFDFRSSEGVPAHITVLHPFAPHPMSDAALDRLRELFIRCEPFEYRLREIGRWPDNVHLLPTPLEPFVALTRRVWVTFPAYPPYEARFPAIVPHLSVAQGRSKLLDEAEALLGRAVPPTGISAVCTEVALIMNTGSAWQESSRFRLGELGGPRT
jgi:hypothetical protein